jgi:hypothetical protein
MTNFVLVPKPNLIPGFLEICPEFEARWKEHCDYWLPDHAGDYGDLSELARFVIDSYEQGHVDIIKRVLDHTERLLEKKDPQISRLLVIGLLEDIQIISSHFAFGPEVFVPYLGPISLWRGMGLQRHGKANLA